MDEPLDYPEDDLDALLDAELEVEAELEKENREIERGRGVAPAKRSLEFSSVLGGSRVTDGNVGLGGGSMGKRARSEEDEEEGGAGTGKRVREAEPVLSELPSNLAGAGVSRIRVPRMGERKVFRRVPNGEFQAVTLLTPGYEKFYLRVRGESSGPGVGVGAAQEAGRPLRPVGLCGLPYHELARLAQEERRAMTARREVEQGTVLHGTEHPTELWVEKFRPRTYTDLLSDDGTNRTLLMWLKLWDKLVFNKERKVKPKKEEEAGKFKPWSGLPEVDEEVDSMGRPKQRVALLHGPPGLGKTTLAHIVARHAGYNVVEVNASDDRSVEALQRKLEAATQMRSVMGQQPRPNCLVIDEIDGAPAPTINWLVAQLSGKQDQKKKKRKGEVLRPIICICNELYTASLRPLRQLALTVPFPPTQPARLATRLKEITSVERLKADLSGLLALCRLTDNDIRSCLATLQFCRQQGTPLQPSQAHHTQHRFYVPRVIRLGSSTTTNVLLVQ